jgi:chromosome segregation ATPase
MNKEQNKGLQWWHVALIAVLLFFSFRFLAAFRFVIFGVFFAVILIFGLYHLRDTITGWRRERAFRKSPEGKVQTRIDYCRAEIEKNRTEMEEIRQNIKDLEEKSDQRNNVSAQARKESQELIREFRSELHLREAKLAFYQSAVRKLDSLMHNYLLNRELEQKKEKLKLLKEDHYEDLARLEELKSDMEMDVFYLDTIEQLSSRLMKTKSLDDAQRLKVELDEMTRELEDL